MESTAPSSLRRDILSAYVLSAARIASWAFISALVYRMMGRTPFAYLALMRGTLGLLAYMSLGIGPAAIKFMAEAIQSRAAAPLPVIPARNDALDYYTPETRRNDLYAIYCNASAIAMIAAACGAAIVIFYSAAFNDLHRVPPFFEGKIGRAAGIMGMGMACRLASEAAGALLQTHGRISYDNYLQAKCELIWVVLCLIFLPARSLQGIAWAFTMSSIVLLFLRAQAAGKIAGDLRPGWRLVNGEVLKNLLSFGGVVVLGQLADFLYAPAAYVILNQLLGTRDVASYAPAVQIDAAVLVLVGGLASVVLPRCAIAHAAGRHRVIRGYYIRGTVISTVLLMAASAAIWVLSPWMLRWWLGESMPATQAILPLVLVHTVIGGSSAVGRSVLLGMGKVKPFTIAAILGGVANVVLAYCFVKYLQLGLAGIVYATIIAVTARCAVWMPWYVLRTLRYSGSLEMTTDYTDDTDGSVDGR